MIMKLMMFLQTLLILNFDDDIDDENDDNNNDYYDDVYNVNDNYDNLSFLLEERLLQKSFGCVVGVRPPSELPLV